MHLIVANQLLADDPPETWQTVRRLAGMCYDWHNVMHMIARLISDDVYGAVKESRETDRGLRATLAATTRRLAATAGRRTALTERRHTPPRSSDVAAVTVVRRE
jgi:hypothetical protein